MKYYKSLAKDNKGPYSGFDFTAYLPKGKRPGKWLPIVKELEMCNSGWHCCKINDLVSWLNKVVYEVEIRGGKKIGEDKICAEQMRIVRLVLNKYNLQVFACDCADHVLHFFEDKYPNDKRPREAIEAGRKFAKGEITAAARAAARDAAWDAARAAAGDAAGDAEWAAWAAWAAWDAAGVAEKKWRSALLKKYLRGAK